MWEEKGEKVEERRRASEQNEQKQSQTGSQTNIQEAKKVAVVNWWKACRVEGATGRKKRTVSETEEKLQQAEQTISDMQEQLRHLQTSLRSAQEREGKQTDSAVVHADKGTNTEEKEKDADRPTKKLLRDAAVATEASGGAAESTQLQVTADGLLTSLRRMEALVNNAMEKAELVRESEQRVSQVTVRMESITQRVEEALERAAGTDQQLSCLEARITQASAQVCRKCVWPKESPMFSFNATVVQALTAVFVGHGQIKMAVNESQLCSHFSSLCRFFLAQKGGSSLVVLCFPTVQSRRLCWCHTDWTKFNSCLGDMCS